MDLKFPHALQQQEKGTCTMVTFKLDPTATLTNKEKRILAAAKELPIVYDDDSPELTDDMERAFAAARK